MAGTRPRRPLRPSFPVAPDDAVDRESRTLTRKLQAARSFCFVVYFVEDARTSGALRARLESHVVGMGRRFVVVAVDEASGLVSGTMAGVFAAMQGSAADARGPVVWLEAYQGSGDADWDAERRSLLMRMNERRSRFESTSGVALVLLLPAGMQRDAASLAPDLWHVRLHSAVLAMDAETVAADEQTALPWMSGRATSTRTPFPRVTGSSGAPAYWERLQADSGARESLSFADAFDAIRGWRQAGEPAKAVALAASIVELARARVADGTATAAELVVALREQASALLDAHDPPSAIDALSEGMSVVDADDAPEPRHAALRVTLLHGLGSALLDAGRPAEAAERFRESLAPLRAAGASAEAIAAVLNRVGDALMMNGDTELAFGAYGESVELWRRVLGAAGSSGEPLFHRGLAQALVGLGLVEDRRGHRERAMTAYREANRLLRDAHGRSGAVHHEVERELAILHVILGKAELAIGRFQPALLAFDEALRLSRGVRDPAPIWRELDRGLQAVRAVTVEPSVVAEATRLLADMPRGVAARE